MCRHLSVSAREALGTWREKRQSRRRVPASAREVGEPGDIKRKEEGLKAVCDVQKQGDIQKTGRAMKKGVRYQMRKAAGLYWLIDMEQSGSDWREPVAVNESGAFIWERYQCLRSEIAVAEELNRERGVPVQEALTDIRHFLQQLEEQGIVLQ